MQEQAPSRRTRQRYRDVLSGAVGFLLFLGLAVFAWQLDGPADGPVGEARQPLVATATPDREEDADPDPRQDDEPGETDPNRSAAEEPGATPTGEATGEAGAGEAEGGEAEGGEDAGETEDPAEPTTPSAPTGAASGPVLEVADLLGADAPRTVVVLGDATGDTSLKWVHAWGRSMALERPVSISHWNATADAAYHPVVALPTEAEGAALMIWNGSAPGATPATALDGLTDLVPETPDAILLNFGRSATASEFPAQLDALVDALRGRYGDLPVVMVLQNPPDPGAGESVRAAGEQWADRAGVGVLDVAASFPAPDDELPPDTTSTSAIGQQRWANVVTEAFG